MSLWVVSERTVCIERAYVNNPDRCSHGYVVSHNKVHDKATISLTWREDPDKCEVLRQKFNLDQVQYLSASKLLWHNCYNSGVWEQTLGKRFGCKVFIGEHRNNTVMREGSETRQRRSGTEMPCERASIADPEGHSERALVMESEAIPGQQGEKCTYKSFPPSRPAAGERNTSVLKRTRVRHGSSLALCSFVPLSLRYHVTAAATSHHNQASTSGLRILWCEATYYFSLHKRERGLIHALWFEGRMALFPPPPTGFRKLFSGHEAIRSLRDIQSLAILMDGLEVLWRVDWGGLHHTGLIFHMRWVKCSTKEEKWQQMVSSAC